jgi:hypothetical protein
MPETYGYGAFCPYCDDYWAPTITRGHLHMRDAGGREEIL